MLQLSVELSLASSTRSGQISLYKHHITSWKMPLLGKKSPASYCHYSQLQSRFWIMSAERFCAINKYIFREFCLGSESCAICVLSVNYVCELWEELSCIRPDIIKTRSDNEIHLLCSISCILCLILLCAEL